MLHYERWLFQVTKDTGHAVAYFAHAKAIELGNLLSNLLLACRQLNSIMAL